MVQQEEEIKMGQADSHGNCTMTSSALFLSVKLEKLQFFHSFLELMSRCSSLHV